MTDTGYVSQKNMEYIKNLDYYIFESNHDIEMLMNTRRPLFLKNRIFGDKGHLNNEYSAHVMAQVIGENTKEICLPIYHKKRIQKKWHWIHIKEFLTKNIYILII